jgi:hypothetical protein
MKSRFRITALKSLFVLRTRKRYSCNHTHRSGDGTHEMPEESKSEQRNGKKAAGATRSGRGFYLDEETEVNILGLGRRALGLLVPAAGDEIDTLRGDGGYVSGTVHGIRDKKHARRLEATMAARGEQRRPAEAAATGGGAGSRVLEARRESEAYIGEGWLSSRMGLVR